MKRLFDLFLSFFGIIFLSPLILIASLLIYSQDLHNPFYISKRVGKNEKIFNMIKLRSMVINADKNKVDSTSKNDPRITKIGSFIRKLKLDELSQIINVFIGDMSFVGPRPNVKRETDIYTYLEKNLLKVKPGITDFASIVFSDEANILANQDDPDISYNQLIRPWKSKLGLFYIKKRSLILDIFLIIITLIGIFSRSFSLYLLYKVAQKLNAPEDLLKIILRKETLKPLPPPGSEKIVTDRDI